MVYAGDILCLNLILCAVSYYTLTFVVKIPVVLPEHVYFLACMFSMQLDLPIIDEIVFLK